MHLYFFLTIAFFAGLHMDTSSAVEIDVQPAIFTGEKEKDVKISCALDESEAAAKEIVTIKINGKGGKTIMVIHPNNSILLVNGKKDKYGSEGKIQEDLSKSYLKMTIKNPEPEDAGTYKCLIYYMDESGELVRDKKGGHLQVVDQEMKHMGEMLKKLETKIKDSNDAVSQLVSKEKNTAERLKTMGETVDDRLKEMEDLLNQGTPLVAFTATNTEKFLFPEIGKVLVFPDLILQVDQGYNRNTGVFTAPKAGLYAFHLVVESACTTCSVSIDLRSDSKTLITLTTGDRNIRDQTSVSTIVKLQAGNTVKTVVTNATPGVYLTFKKRTMFSGYLIN